jgi:hypothetical protein
MTVVRQDRFAGQTAREGDLINDLSVNSSQLRSLLVVLMHAVRSDNVPLAHLETVVWLACDLAAGIQEMTAALAA